MPYFTEPVIAGDGVTDDAPAINAALADPAATIVVLPAATIAVGSSITIPSGKSLRGSGRDATVLIPTTTFDPVAVTNALVTTDQGAVGIGVFDLLIDAQKIKPVVEDIAIRVSALQLRQTRRFTVARVDVRNCSGYGHHAAGLPGETPVFCGDGIWEDCRSWNCNVHFEQQVGEDIVVRDCASYDGDGDVPCENYFHPLDRSRRILYDRCRVRGVSYGSILYPTDNIPLEDISFHQCDFETSQMAIAAAPDGIGVNRLGLYGCRFVSTGTFGGQFSSSNGRIIGCDFAGKTNGLRFFGGDFDVEGSRVTATNNSGEAVYGVLAPAGVMWNGGSISATGIAQTFTVVGGARVSRETRLSSHPNGVRVNTAQTNVLIVFSDANRTVSLDRNAAQNFVVYNDSAIAFPEGSTVDVVAGGVGAKALLPDTGVTIRSPTGTIGIAAYGSVRLTKLAAANTWRVSGDLI